VRLWFSDRSASSPVSIQTQPLALRALRKRKPKETQALALAKQPIMVATASTEHSYWQTVPAIWNSLPAELTSNCASLKLPISNVI